jgi:hypothetical protein
MSDNPIDKGARSFAEARKRLQAGSTDKSKKATKAREKALIGNTDKRHLRRSGRTELWGIRCRPGLKAECKKIASELDMLDSEWAEQVFEAAIRAHRERR